MSRLRPTYDFLKEVLRTNRAVTSKLRPTPAFMKRLEFLQSGKIHLKDSVKAITLYYNTWGSGSTGIRWGRWGEAEGGGFWTEGCLRTCKSYVAAFTAILEVDMPL